MENFAKKTKIAKSGTENALFRYFWGTRFKNYCHICNRSMKFPKLENFAKNKLPKFEIKNVLLRHTWARILKSYCHISNQQPPISQIEKFYENAKMRKVGTKMPFLGIFAPNFEKNYCHVLN